MTAERSSCSPRASNCFFTTSNSRTTPSIASNARPNAQAEAEYGLRPELPARYVASKPLFPSSPRRVGRFYAALVFRRFPKTRHQRRSLPRRLLRLLDLPLASSRNTRSIGVSTTIASASKPYVRCRGDNRFLQNGFSRALHRHAPVPLSACRRLP
jgi:hypothetical protein